MQAEAEAERARAQERTAGLLEVTKTLRPFVAANASTSTSMRSIPLAIVAESGGRERSGGDEERVVSLPQSELRTSLHLEASLR